MVEYRRWLGESQERVTYLGSRLADFLIARQMRPCHSSETGHFKVIYDYAEVVFGLDDTSSD